MHNFIYESLPVLFHSQTDEFIKYFERDGLKFLRFWWDHLGERLPEDMRSPFEGFEGESYELPPTRVILIAFPHPREDGEAFFLALMRDPERRFGWLKFPNTRIIALVCKGEGAQLGYLTPRSLFVPIQEVIQPGREAFKEFLSRLPKPK
jgi:hypothetical protein